MESGLLMAAGGALIALAAFVGIPRNSNPTPSFGFFFLTAGLLLASYFYFGFDTSVRTSSNQRVNNIGLMAQQQNGLIIGLGVCIIGVILLCSGAAPKASQEITSHAAKDMQAADEDNYECPHCAETIKRRARICRFCKNELAL